MSRDVLPPSQFLGGLNALHSLGMKRGDSTGWACVDELYTVQPGQLTVVTGWPGSGKSEFVDAMLLNLARNGWRFAMFSPENRPTAMHVAKLVEKLVGKPFGAGPTERATWDEVKSATALLDASFGFVQPRMVEVPTVHTVVTCADDWFHKTGGGDEKLGLVIDPWNELDHGRPSDRTETEYISQTLSFVRNWARECKVHVWIVAHPSKQRREDGKLPVPRPDMIAGSQHWWNKADNCLSVWRDYDDSTAPVQIHVQKIRFKNVGRIGVAELRYDRPTGRYWEPKAEGNVVYSLARTA